MLADLAADRNLRAVILTGSGRGFCSGQDLKDLGADEEGSGLGRVQFGMAWQARAAALVQRIHALPQPVIAAVNGAASGAGLSIALAADTRLAATSAKFNAAFVRIGLSGGDMGASYFLPRIVGPTAATEILFTGRMVAGRGGAPHRARAARRRRRPAVGRGPRHRPHDPHEQPVRGGDDQGGALAQHRRAQSGRGDRAGEPHPDPGQHDRGRRRGRSPRSWPSANPKFRNH